jgi:hypothetical protein
MEDFFGDMIFSYTRAQAIEDGVLVDVTDAAREVGLALHTAVTESVWAEIRAIPEAFKGSQDEKSRLQDILVAAAFHARIAPEGMRQIFFRVIMPVEGESKRQHTYQLHIGPGDVGEPVLTIMQEYED